MVHSPFIQLGHRETTTSERPCNSNKSLDDRDFPPLMCYSLQISLSCILFAKAYRAESESSLAVSAGRIGIRPCFHPSLVETIRKSPFHQRPRWPASPPLSLLKRSSVVSTMWMNATTFICDIGSREARRYRHTCRNAQGLSSRQASSIQIQLFVGADRDGFRPEYLREAYT